MRFKQKFAGLFAAALLLLPGLSHAYTINGNLDVRGNIIGGIRRIGETNNLTLSLVSGTLKIQCGNADCSASNPGWVTLPSNTAGQMVTYKITTSPTFDDDTATDSDFQGTGTCSWGTTAAVAWANQLPTLIGAFHDGTTLVFGIARGPVLTTGASTNIGYKDVCPSTAAQANVIAWTATNVTATHANKAFFPIGAVRFTKSVADDSTFATLDSGDGINVFYNFGVRLYVMVTGQVTSGKYMSDNGGTAPTFTATNQYIFNLSMDGKVSIAVRLANSAGGTAGAGAVQSLMDAPYSAVGGASDKFKGAGSVVNGSFSRLHICQVNGITKQIYSIYDLQASSAFAVTNNVDFNNGTREFDCTLQYPAF